MLFSPDFAAGDRFWSEPCVTTALVRKTVRVVVFMPLLTQHLCTLFPKQVYFLALALLHTCGPTSTPLGAYVMPVALVMLKCSVQCIWDWEKKKQHSFCFINCESFIVWLIFNYWLLEGKSDALKCSSRLKANSVTTESVEFLVSPSIDRCISLPFCSCSGTLGLCVSVGFWPWAQSLYLRRNASMSTAAGSSLKKVVVSHLGSLSPCSLTSASWQDYW